MKKVVVLGATGSIGDSTFRVLKGLGPEYQVVGISGGKQLDKLAALAQVWQPAWVGVAEKGDAPALAAQLPGARVVAGEEGLCQLASLPEVELVINGLVGAVGLRPSLAALEAGKTLGMANKEPIVMAGGLLLAAGRAGGGQLLPLDSEPNALWQCLKGEEPGSLARLILTASGGPFRGRTRGQLAGVTPEQALRHPTWKMGAKITVDSATLMNKGFEVIEASWLFGVGVDRVEVVIHPESVVHSLAEFTDGALLAHLGRTDMSMPIHYALTHPNRRPASLERLDLTQVGQLRFAAPDRENFPCLDLCYRAGRAGGTAPALLSGADEVAVAAFLEGRISFLDIAELNRQVLEAQPVGPADSLAAVLAADAQGRRLAAEWIANRIPEGAR
ncbi:MAG: 1-deoxy-D-xylulose-5-phosphate reductoisomerase [Candidatus Handelsmanbacteria bacterium]|nr:1-deoxy-D-xylulose-5-phosphate reductoisomerase [Candidatus Handelsmanbacteria bacterium]